MVSYVLMLACSGGPKQVKYRNTEYRSLGILTEPNNTKPNHREYRNKGTLLLYIFYCIFMQHFFSYLFVVTRFQWLFLVEKFLEF